MRIRDFVYDFNKRALNLSKNPTPNDVLVAHESDTACLEIKNLCDEFKESDLSVSPENLKPFIDFLALRGEFVNHSCRQAGYTSNYKTDANDTSFELAKTLAYYLQASTLSFLIPTLKTDRVTANRFIQYPQHFVLNDTCTNFIDLQTYQTPDEAKSLSDAETARIEDKIKWIKDIDKDKPVNYQEFSRVSLKKFLHSDILELNQLTDVMATYPLEQRCEFLRTFTFNQHAVIALNGTRFRDVVNNRENYIGDEDHARNALMVLASYYQKVTEMRTEDFKSKPGSWFRYDKQSKLKSVKLILDFLESGDDLSNFRKLLDSNDCKDVKNAMLDGDLGALSYKIIAVSAPENRHLEQPAKSWYSWS